MRYCSCNNRTGVCSNSVRIRAHYDDYDKDNRTDTICHPSTTTTCHESFRTWTDKGNCGFTEAQTNFFPDPHTSAAYAAPNSIITDAGMRNRRMSLVITAYNDQLTTHFHQPIMSLNMTIQQSAKPARVWRHIRLVIMRPSSLGGGRILRRTLSVCPSVPLADVLCLQLHRLTSEHPK